MFLYFKISVVMAAKNSSEASASYAGALLNITPIIPIMKPPPTEKVTENNKENEVEVSVSVNEDEANFTTVVRRAERHREKHREKHGRASNRSHNHNTREHGPHTSSTNANNAPQQPPPTTTNQNIETMDTSETSNEPKVFVAAPPPKVNIWQVRQTNPNKQTQHNQRPANNPRQVLQPQKQSNNTFKSQDGKSSTPPITLFLFQLLRLTA